jgi:hypothetical protein
MNQKLENIFVSVDVAKLAKEKGFNEWCACLYHINTGSIIPNEHEGDFDYKYDVNDKGSCFCIPTHFQLIVWLRVKHRIYVSDNNIASIETYNRFSITQFMSTKVFVAKTINEALTIALNLIEKP